MRTKGLRNESYYILFTDDYSSYRHIYPLEDKSKEEVLQCFKTYIAVAERQTGCPLKTFTLDRGGEFVNTLMNEHLKSLGIELHLTAGHAPEQNGVAERSNRTVGSKARSMMMESGLPLRFWYQACEAAVFLSNRTITKAVPGFKTPFELWHFRKPSIDHLRVFGCKSYRIIRKELRESKYSQVSSEGVLVGFDQDNFNYQIYDLQDKKIHMSHDVKFNEDAFPFIKLGDSPTSNSDVRVRVLYSDEDDCGNRVDEVTPHTNPDCPSTGLELEVDELDTHTDSQTPDLTPTLPTTTPESDSPGGSTPTVGTRKSSRVRNDVSYRGLCNAVGAVQSGAKIRLSP